MWVYRAPASGEYRRTMTAPQTQIALNAQSLPGDEAGSDAPEWVHLLPAASGAIQTGDRRGPFP